MCGLRIENHINKVFSSVSYVLFDDAHKNCWIVDIGDYDQIRELIDGYKLQAVFLTHAHYDHIYGIVDLHKKNPLVPIYTNFSGKTFLASDEENLSFFHNSPLVFVSDKVVAIEDRCKIPFQGDVEFQAVFTPGHNPSCITWIVGDGIFTGDSYIPGIKTVTNLLGSNKQQAMESEKLILNLAENRAIFPGHVVCNTR